MSSLLLKLVDRAEGSSVRGMVTPDGKQAFSVYDFMTSACGYKDTGASARKEFKRVIGDGSQHQNEVVASCHYLKFPGAGQRDTPCMTIRGLQRLLMILGGKVAAEFRQIIEGTFTRVMAGDQSLIEVINANAVSEAPIQQAFRAALAQEPVAPVLDELCLGKKRERDDLLFDMEMAERRAALEDRKAALEERKLKHASNLIEHANTALGSINGLKAWAHVDERTKLQMEDHIKNVVFNSMGTSTLAITNSAQPTAALNVSILAKELGFKCLDGQLQRIGKDMAKAYREAYKCEPTKHKQYVGGNYIPVNSYMERDREMMARVIRAVMAVK